VAPIEEPKRPRKTSSRAQPLFFTTKSGNCSIQRHPKKACMHVGDLICSPSRSSEAVQEAVQWPKTPDSRKVPRLSAPDYSHDTPFTKEASIRKVCTRLLESAATRAHASRRRRGRIATQNLARLVRRGPAARSTPAARIRTRPARGSSIPTARAHARLRQRLARIARVPPGRGSRT